MIEIIQQECYDREQEERELPKNIRQIGSPDIGDRIYIENRAYRFMHPGGEGADRISGEDLPEKAVYVLLGKFQNAGGRSCVFVCAAIWLEEIAFDGNTPVWNDESWAYLYKKLKHAYDDLVIVGWALDIRGGAPSLTIAAERLHRTYFGGAHQVLYLMDSMEKEDAFYSLKNGYLKKREGYYIYYDKKNAAQQEKRSAEKISRKGKEAVAQTKKADGQEEADDARWKEALYQKEEQEDARDAAGLWERQRIPSYRAYLQRSGQKGRAVPSYGLSVFLLLVICGLGYAAFQNHEKMAAMETAILRMNDAQTASTEESRTVTVESVAGSVTPEASAEDADTVAQVDAAAQNTADTEQLQTAAGAGALTEEAVQDIGATQDATQEASQNAAQTADTGSEQTTVASDTTTQTTAGDDAVQTSTVATDYLAQGYYIVQKGDSLVGICRKVYQTTAMLDELCEANGIDNPDAIYEGQYLTLPD